MYVEVVNTHLGAYNEVYRRIVVGLHAERIIAVNCEHRFVKHKVTYIHG